MVKAKLKKRPLALIILSGFGWTTEIEGNAIRLARTPFLDGYLSKYKHALLESSGVRVGLRPGQEGNSEVSHMIMGTGQVVPLDIDRIDDAIDKGTFFENPILIDAIEAGRRSGLHLLGMVSDGGVHSMNTHLYALLEMAARRGIERVSVHVITDGRDTPPNSGKKIVSDLILKLQELGTGRIASITGRYYAMDRDNRWDRIKQAYDAIANGEGRRLPDPIAAIQSYYDHGLTDEFIEPTVITYEDGSPIAQVKPGDSLIFFNFRADRSRQLTRAFTGLNFDGFDRERIRDLNFATFTQYDRSLNSPIVFPPIEVINMLAEVFARNEVSNLRISETEKFANVTYFFNGGIEKVFPFESRISIPSPQTQGFDHVPEMSAFKMTDSICRAIDAGETDVYVINFPNCDSVGHTGDLKAAIKAVEAVDTCLGWVVGSIERAGGVALITSDHGNCEQMIDPETEAPHTAHTDNPVPFIICDPEFKGDLKDNRSLEDIAPTILDLLGIDQPKEMSGESLLIRSI